MKFSIGYQLPGEGEEPFAALVADFREHVAEVYFAPPGAPSGRAPLPVDDASRRRMEDDLRALRGQSVALNVLFNANCYGHLATSRTLERRVVDEMRRLETAVGGADSVTTTSPAVAAILRRHFPGLEVRASVNMRIGTVQGMEYLADLFDGFYVQRDYNRDLDHLRRMRLWADSHGKTLHMLANSGCLRFCSAQTFHDNLVAHETDVVAAENIEGFLPHTCWKYLRDRTHWVSVLQATWVRPEDLHHYESLFPTVKLATRMHDNPRAVVRAYARGRCTGNLLDLLEPGFGPLLAPFVIDNRRFPSDWFEHSVRCRPSDQPCAYCLGVLEKVLVSVA